MQTITKMKESYQSVLTTYQTEKAIAEVKSYFSSQLASRLNLIKVEAPMLVIKGTGINDDLNGTESPVRVNVKSMPEISVEIVHSLAKWKRLKLAKLEADPGEGIYTDMKALRPDEDLSDIHSVYVDQWDWEKVILAMNRDISYLKIVVRAIYQALLETEKDISLKFPVLKPFLAKEIYFIHSEELQQLYPALSPKERENEICRQKGSVFIMGIGGSLADGAKHDGRAPDYDDWSTETGPQTKGLNGDIMVWNPVLKRAFEISSMGIRVSPEALTKQLLLSGQEDRLQLSWHQSLLKGELPYTIGGGIGQSRLVMLLLQKKHIAEVQSSIWPEEMSLRLIEQNIKVL